MSRWILALPLIGPIALVAQTIALSNGNLLLSAGTTVHIDGPATLLIAPGASITNHGRINLGTQATLVEQPGAPITGTGFEESTWPIPAPLNNAEPGGLGLSLTTAFDEGGLRVERGHIPRTAWNGVEGIARWYRVSVPGSTSEILDATMHFDVTELNSIMPSALAIFHGASESGPWIPSPTLLNAPAQTLTAAVPAPDISITAFDLDAANAVESIDPNDWTCWPLLIETECWVSIPPEEALNEATIFDATGRLIRRMSFPGVTGVKQLSLPDLVSGAYFLRVNNGDRTFKLIKP